MTDSGLRVVELTGALGQVEFPDVCAHCGQFANEKLLIEKVFRQSSSQHGWRYAVDGVRVPFCPPCTAKHQSEARRVSPIQRMLLCFRAGIVVAALGSGGFAVFMAYLALKELAERDMQSAGFLGLVTAGFGIVSALSFRAAYQETRRYALIPPTSVTGAFDFSEDLSQIFEQERRNYTLQNPYFGGAFIERNKSRIWDPQHRTPRRAAARRKVALGIFLLLILIAAAWSILRDWM